MAGPQTGVRHEEPLVIEVDRACGPGRRRGRWARGTTIAWAALVVALAGLVAWFVVRPAAADERLLVVDGSGAVSLLDPATGDAVYEVPGATATPDRSALLTTDDGGGGTVLESRDPATGEVTGTTRLAAADLTVRTVSPQGTAVALLPGPRGGGIFEPEPRERTNLTVSFLDERQPRTFDLDGNLEPEMFSYDDSGLFVLELVPPLEPDSYYVRRLDLATGELTDTGAPEVGLNPRMRGRARASVLHPEGTRLFTLYTLPQTGDPVFDPLDDERTPTYAFIHVIDLEADESFCIFLPQPLGTVDEAVVGMGISPDGEEVIVADPSTSTVARVDAVDLTVTATFDVEELRGTGAKASVAVAGDGDLYIAAGDRVLELRGEPVEAVRVWSRSGPVSAVSLSASGDELRVGGEGAVTILDRSTGAEKGGLRAPGGGTVALLGPPGGSVTEFPLECAC